MYLILWPGLLNAEDGELGWKASQEVGVLAHLWGPWVPWFWGTGPWWMK